VILAQATLTWTLGYLSRLQSVPSPSRRNLGVKIEVILEVNPYHLLNAQIITLYYSTKCHDLTKVAFELVSINIQTRNIDNNCYFPFFTKSAKIV